MRASELVDDLSLETTLTSIRHLAFEIQQQADLVLDRAHRDNDQDPRNEKGPQNE